MSFSELYDAAQQQDGRISTRWLRDTALSLTPITLIKEQWTAALDDSFMRGFYIEGPKAPPVPLKENESLIVLSRSLDKAWRRLVYTKELMHVFDEPDEKTDSAEKLDNQVERFVDPQADTSPYFRAETKALFRAISLFCPEEKRKSFKRALVASEISLDVIAAVLRIPATYARHLFRDDYLKILASVK